MTEQSVSDIAALELPFARQLAISNVEFDSGLNMLRLTFREGRRFTVIDLDASSAAKLAALMGKWAQVSAEKT